jgi:uncharacterized protein (DUF2267 family)
MTYEKFIRSVSERARFSSNDQVVKAVETVLGVLGQRISAGQAEDIGALLPVELRKHLRGLPQAQSFGLSEFVVRVAEQEGIDTATAGEHVNAVLSVLGDVVPRDELKDTFEQLPKDMRNLFARSKKAA